MEILGDSVKVEGKFLRVARGADVYSFGKDPEAMISALKSAGVRADLFPFVQKLSETSPKYQYPMEWDNFAALQVLSFDHWWNNQIKGKTRNMIRKAEKSGVSTREVVFDDKFVKGIQAINDESSVRQGRLFSHYRDDFETVRRENGSFLERSIFIGVFFEGAMIGYGKLVPDESGTQAGLMQILSMIRHRDKAPNNMIIAQAVSSCAERAIPFLWYANYSYRRKPVNSLTDFKQNNGFQQIDFPRYYVPLTLRGHLALRSGLHHGIAEFVPKSLLDNIRKFRRIWHGRKVPAVAASTE
jgi:hypothetical protein